MPIAIEDIPEVKPAYELIDGQLCQKMSPKLPHGLLAFRIGAVLSTWAGDEGFIAVEGRVNVPDGEKRHSLVPDVEYISRARIRTLTQEERRGSTPFAPDIAIEVLSEGDNLRLLAIKIRAYLGAGSKLVLVVDPWLRTIDAHTSTGVRKYAEGESIEPPEFAELSLDLRTIFSILNDLDNA